MTSTRSSTGLDDAFDAFLFASVGEDAHGMPLSVLSALSRLDIDPWADADRLSRLPKASAIVALGQSIALLPAGTWRSTDATAIATRLVELLPKPRTATKATLASARPSADWKRWTTLALVVAVIGLAGYLLLGTLTGIEHRAADGSQAEHERSRSP